VDHLGDEKDNLATKVYKKRSTASNKVNIRTGRLTRAEIKNAMKKLKNGKVARYDYILPEPIQACGETLEEILLDL